MWSSLYFCIEFSVLCAEFGLTESQFGLCLCLLLRHNDRPSELPEVYGCAGGMAGNRLNKSVCGPRECHLENTVSTSYCIMPHLHLDCSN